MRDIYYMTYRLMLLFLFIFMVSFPIYAQDEHTVLLYTFETGDGNLVTDHSGNGNEGNLMGPRWGTGKQGNGLEFAGNGPREFIEIPDSDSLDLVDGLTIEMWVFLNNPSTAGGTGVTKENSYKFGPRISRKAEIRMTTTSVGWGAAALFSDGDLPLNAWVHIAGTYNAESGVASVYIDGELDTESDIGGDIVPNTNVIWVGRGSNPFLDGKLDDIRISNVVRAKKEIQALMNLGIEGVLSVTPKHKLTSTWGRLKSLLYE